MYIPDISAHFGLIDGRMGKTTCQGYWNSKCIFLIEKGTFCMNRSAFCVHAMRQKICFEPYWTLIDKKKIAGNAFSFLKKDRPDSFEKKVLLTITESQLIS